MNRITEIDGWSSTFSTEGLTFNKLQIWKDQFESDGDQDELKLIYDRLNTPGPKLVVLYSLTPLLFRHSPTAVARFICKIHFNFLLPFYSNSCRYKLHNFNHSLGTNNAIDSCGHLNNYYIASFSKEEKNQLYYENVIYSTESAKIKLNQTLSLWQW